MRALVFVALLLTLTPLTVQAYHAECPASFANLTVRVLDGGYYAVLEGDAAMLFQESNGHAGLQRGTTGCAPDTRLV